VTLTFDLLTLKVVSSPFLGSRRTWYRLKAVIPHQAVCSATYSIGVCWGYKNSVNVGPSALGVSSMAGLLEPQSSPQAQSVMVFVHGSWNLEALGSCPFGMGMAEPLLPLCHTWVSKQNWSLLGKRDKYVQRYTGKWAVTSGLSKWLKVIECNMDQPCTY